MKLAIVEDEIIQSQHIVHLIEKIGKEMKQPMSVTAYTSSEAFLFSYEDTDYDGILLDIKMDGMNGFELAKVIRSKNDSVLLAFLTGETEYVYDGYEVNACGYLLKPVKEDRLKNLLFRMIEQLKETKRKLCIKTKDGIQTILEDDILLLESQNHNIKMETKQEIILFRGKLSDYESQLNKEIFFQPHRSYLIHIGHIKKISKKECIMTNNQVIPIARGKYESLMNQYMGYHRGLM